MSDVAERLTVPDIALQCLGGRWVDLADFRGQNLLVFFCPGDAAAAAREIEEFRALADPFADAGVWVLGVLQESPPQLMTKFDGARIELARDPDGCAWAHFEPALACDGKPDRSAGAVFLFERWGTLRKAWPSSGHARDALKAASGRM